MSVFASGVVKAERSGDIREIAFIDRGVTDLEGFLWRDAS